MTGETRGQIWHEVWNERDPDLVEFNGWESLFPERDAHLAFMAEVASFIADTLRLRPSDRLADLGCGTGMVASMIARQVASIIAIDYSAHALEVARARHQAPNIQFRQDNLNSLDPATRAVDKAYCLSAFHYLDDYKVARQLLEGLLERQIEVLVLDVPDEGKRRQIQRPYDMERYSHLYFDEDRLRGDFKNITVFRGLFPASANDAVRFSFHLAP
jgi:trans-aconitate methyltransferase